ncbi:Retrovirus-related Pol polyprotein from type-2 retrotransposable element R2DM, partial [Trichinella sp. T8]
MPEEAEALTVPRGILREPGSATVIEAVEIYAPVPPRAVTAAQQMIHQIRQSSLAAPRVTSEHNFVMEVAIQEARRTNAQLAISWLDISNAFGTVSHEVLFSLLDRYGLDPTFTCFIKNLYKDATIVVKGANGTHVTARWSVGVRQGDPCSGILFCLFVEPLLRSVLPVLPCEAETTAVNVFGQPITALAYADDIALFAPSIGVMQHQLCKIQGMASAMGFRFNPKKCASLYLNRAVVNAATFTISGEEIPALVHGDTFRYLGVAAGLGKPQTPFSLLRENLREAELIFRSKLAPWQKMDAYRSYVLPRLTFQLMIAKFNNIKQSAGQYDRAILRLVKRCFQLPVETSTDFIRAPRQCGGLGVPSLRELYATAKVSRALKMLWSPCRVVSSLAASQLQRVAAAYFAKRSSVRSYQNCRRCGYDRETLPHILQHCRQFSAPAYQARHDAVQIGSNKRSHLVVFDEEKPSVILLDVAIVFENTAAAFVDARTRRWPYYEKEILAYRLRGYSVTYDAIVVGGLGTWDQKKDAILKRIGVVSQRYLRLMKVLVVSE